MPLTGKHILIVDDDPDICDLLCQIVSNDGYRITRAADAASAQAAIGTNTFDLMLLDLMMPGTDGLTFCRQLRSKGIELPIIMLTAKGDDFDRVLGLEMGADDYVPKPFHSRELLARIKAVLRRTTGNSAKHNTLTGRFYKFGQWRLDTAKRELLSQDDVVLLLSSAEYELLVAFLAWPQMTLSREKLVDATRGGSALISDRSVDIQVSRLRKKLGDDPKYPRIIKTVWGDGYLFALDVSK
jgi:two-component system, OmpR family, response regulator